MPRVFQDRGMSGSRRKHVAFLNKFKFVTYIFNYKPYTGVDKICWSSFPFLRRKRSANSNFYRFNPQKNYCRFAFRLCSFIFQMLSLQCFVLLRFIFIHKKVKKLDFRFKVCCNPEIYLLFCRLYFLSLWAFFSFHRQICWRDNVKINTKWKIIQFTNFSFLSFFHRCWIHTWNISSICLLVNYFWVSMHFSFT